MEGIGSATAIIQLISFTGDVLAAGYGYLSKVKKAPSEVRALLKETASLNELLDQISELSEDQAENKSGSALNALHRLGILEDCGKLMNTVQGMLKACEGNDGQKLRNAGKRLLWPFKEKDTKDLLDQLGRLRETLTASITVDSARTLKAVEEISRNVDRNVVATLENIFIIQDDLNDIRTGALVASENVGYIKTMTEIRIEEEENAALRKWLYGESIGNDSRLKDSIELRHPETGKWFMLLVEKWRIEDQSCIWFYGIAGTGKTTLAAMAIEQLQNTAPFDGSLILHFFFERRGSGKQSTQDLLHAMAKQLLDASQECVTEAKRWRDDRKVPMGAGISKPLSLLEYINLVKDLCSNWTRVVLVLDALDECSNLKILTQSLGGLANGTNLRLLVTSRFDVEMQSFVHPLSGLQVSITELMQDDIHIYLASEVQSRISCGALKFRTPGMDQMIVEELQKRADGMILLATLHLDYICALKSDRAIKDALIKLPSKIYTAYDEILDQLCHKNPESIDDLKSILQWLTYSIVPLNARQIAEVISIREKDTCLDETGIVTDYTDLVALCGSLVTVASDNVNPGLSIIKLSHASVEEYLKSGKMRVDLAQIFPLELRSANLSIYKTCLQYISFEDFQNPIAIKESQSNEDPRKWLFSDRACLAHRSSKYALAEYACRYWADHLSRIKDPPMDHEDFVCHLEWFTNPEKFEGNYRSWQQMYHHDIRYYCKDRPPLHYAIEFRIDNLVSMLLPPKDKIDDLVGGKSLLHIAARCGALNTMEQLISLGADVNLSSGVEEKCMTVLHFAAEGGHAEALRLLIKHGAMIDSRSTSLSTPFYRAARSGSLEALKTLYDAGADIDAKTWDHWTPLFESISHGRRRIASQLLQWGADLTAVTLQGENTLMMLRRNRNEQILADNAGLSDLQREVMFVNEENILEEIEAIRKLGNEKEIKNGFDALVKGLAKHYILVLAIDKDTRPGTKREKDQRFPNDPRYIITSAEHQDKYLDEDEEPKKLSLRLTKWSKSAMQTPSKTSAWAMNNGLLTNNST